MRRERRRKEAQPQVRTRPAGSLGQPGQLVSGPSCHATAPGRRGRWCGRGSLPRRRFDRGSSPSTSISRCRGPRARRMGSTGARCWNTSLSGRHWRCCASVSGCCAPAGCCACACPATPPSGAITCTTTRRCARGPAPNGRTTSRAGSACSSTTSACSPASASSGISTSGCSTRCRWCWRSSGWGFARWNVARSAGVASTTRWAETLLESIRPARD
jgi:hypothetical protein